MDKAKRRLVDLQITEVSGVEDAANRRRFLVIKQAGGGENVDKADKPMKTEDGVQFPAEAYLYVPDPEKPSTWKLRVWEDPEQKATAAQVGRAIAALSPGGFRGNPVELPAEEVPGIKAKLRQLWRQLNPDRDLEEMPFHLKKQGFLARLAEGVRTVFKADFATRMRTARLDDQLWRAFDALRSAIYDTREDQDLSSDEKMEQIAVSLGQFQEFLAGLTVAGLGKSDEDVTKVGAKIARHRLERLKAAHTVLGEILAEVEPEDKEEEPMNKDELVKAVEETLADRLATIGKRVDPLAELPAKLEELLKRHGELLSRIEALEAQPGSRKSVPGQDPGADQVKKSIFHGIL